MSEPLCVQVVSNVFSPIVARFEGSVSRSGRPLGPGSAATLRGGSEVGIVPEQGTGSNETLELVAPGSGATVQNLCQELEDHSFLGEQPPVFDSARRPKGPELFLKGSGFEGLSGFDRDLPFRGSCRIDEHLVPEQAAGRRVGARIEGLVEKRRQKRQRGNDSASEVGRPVHECAQIGEIPGTPTTFRM